LGQYVGSSTAEAYVRTRTGDRKEDGMMEATVTEVVFVEGEIIQREAGVVR